MMFMRLRLLMIFLFGGLFLTYLGYREFKESQHVRAEPDRITCKTFDKRGPTENNHVELVAFTTADDAEYACMSSGRGNPNYFALALVPVYSRTRNSVPNGDEFRTILQFHGVNGYKDLDRQLESGLVQGVCVGKASQLSPEAQAVLTDSYPGLDFHACRIIKVGGVIPNAKRALLMMLGGGAMVLCFGGYMFWAFKSGSTSQHLNSKQKVDTSDPNFMKKRMPTELDPEKFRESRRDFAPANTEATEEDPAVESEEDLAYRRQFAEQYGLSTDVMDKEAKKNSDDGSWTPTTLEY